MIVIVETAVGLTLGIAVVIMFAPTHPLETHIKSSLYIIKVFAILYMLVVPTWFQIKTFLACYW